MRKIRIYAWMVALVLFGTTEAWAHGDDDAPAGKTPEKLGKAQFPVSCNAAAQKEFNRAMALFHSFWWAPGKQSFARVLELDPGCGMGDWGIAWMSLGNPFTLANQPERREDWRAGHG